MTDSQAVAVSNPPSDMPRILPHLVYEDVGGAVAWLSRTFDFQERTWVRHTETDGSVSRTQMQVADSVITLGTPSMHGDSPRHGVSSMLYVYVDRVDEHFRRAVAAGAAIDMPVCTQPWGDRLYQVTDPEGHHWTFAQHVADVDPTAEHLHGADIDPHRF